MSLILGIDPGVSGAYALITDDEHRQVFRVDDLPLLTARNGKSLIDAATLAADLRDIGEHTITFAVLEEVSAMPARGAGGERRTMGTTSAFGFGRGFGAIEAVLALLQIPTTYATPQRWKKNAHLIGADKDFARTLATRIFPEAATRLSRKKDVGRADAILIAHFGK